MFSLFRPIGPSVLFFFVFCLFLFLFLFVFCCHGTVLLFPHISWYTLLLSLEYDVIMRSYINGWYLFWYTWKEDVHTMVINKDYNDLQYCLYGGGCNNPLRNR